MIKRFPIILISIVFVLALATCEKEGPAEKAGKKIDETVEEVGDKVEDAGNEVEEKVEEKVEDVKK